MNKIEIIESKIDILLERVNEDNINKYSKKELLQEYYDIEDLLDDIFVNVDARKQCIEKMRKLNGHFFHSNYSSEYFDIIDAMEQANADYDEDAELDMMFPNRHDENFDEDSMSYDSVFGDD